MEVAIAAKMAGVAALAICMMALLLFAIAAVWDYGIEAPWGRADRAIAVVSTVASVALIGACVMWAGLQMHELLAEAGVSVVSSF